VLVEQIVNGLPRQTGNLRKLHDAHAGLMGLAYPLA